MKIIRILVYEGEEKDLNTHMNKTFMAAYTKFTSPAISITETFRGSEEDLEKAWISYGESINLTNYLGESYWKDLDP